MLNSGRPGQTKAMGLAIFVLLVVWFYKLSLGSNLVPARNSGETWEQKHIDIANPTVESTSSSNPNPTVEAVEPTSVTEAENTPEVENTPDVENTPEVEALLEAEATPEAEKTTEVEKATEVEKTPAVAKPTEDAVQSPNTESKPDASKTHEKTIIMGKTSKEDATWVKKKLLGWRPAIYAVDSRTDPDYLHVTINKGRESMPYLTYLIDYYDDLSDINVFIHSHEEGYPQAWHNEPQSAEYSAVKMLNLLRFDNVRKKGYVNLRCNPTPGCPAELHPNGEKIEKGRIEIGWKKLWKHMNGNEKYPAAVGVACCAQFAVTREKIHEKPKEYYQKLMDWLLTTDEEDAGRVFEYFWHMIFGMPAVHCEKNYATCICDTYDCNAGAGKKRSLNTLAMKRII